MTAAPAQASATTTPQSVRNLVKERPSEKCVRRSVTGVMGRLMHDRAAESAGADIFGLRPYSRHSPEQEGAQSIEVLGEAPEGGIRRYRLDAWRSHQTHVVIGHQG